MSSLAVPTLTGASRLDRRLVRAGGALVLAGGALLLNLWFWGATVRDEPILVVVRDHRMLRRDPTARPGAAEILAYGSAVTIEKI